MPPSTPRTPLWLSAGDSVFPQNIFRFLRSKPPDRIAVLGNLSILNTSSIALVCSVKCPGNIILQIYDLARHLRDSGVTVIGGFHSPMERECLRILLRGTQPIIICPARSLEGMRLTREFRTALDQGRLLFLSPLPKHVRRVTMENAMQRNQLICGLAHHIFLPHATPASKTFELCRSLLLWENSLYTFANEANNHLIDLGVSPLEGNADILHLLGKSKHPSPEGS